MRPIALRADHQERLLNWAVKIRSHTRIDSVMDTASTVGQDGPSSMGCMGNSGSVYGAMSEDIERE